MLNISNLKLYIFRPPLSHNDAVLFEKLYFFLKKNWQATYSEIGNTQSAFFSDNFFRQHEIFALFEADKPIACVAHRYVNLSFESTYDDSYFSSPWNKVQIDQLKSIGGPAAIGSQIMVAPEYRRVLFDVNDIRGLKELISCLSLYELNLRDINTIIGTMRADKGMHKLFYSLGAECIGANLKYFNATVDLVIFSPKKKPIRFSPQAMNHIASLISKAHESAPMHEKPERIS